MALIPTTNLSLLIPSGTPTGAAGVALKGNFQTIDTVIGSINLTLEAKIEAADLAPYLTIATAASTFAPQTSPVFSGTIVYQDFGDNGDNLLKVNSGGQIRPVTAAAGRTILGLGSAATATSSSFASSTHTHAISDITSLQSSLNLKAPLAGPTFTGTVTMPTLTVTTAASGGFGVTNLLSVDDLGNVTGVASTTFVLSSATIAASRGGTGQTSYAVGDLLYASTTSAISKLADVATGNALISGGTSTAPSFGKIGLTTHVSGTLAAGNGGTGVTSFGGTNALLYTSATSTLSSVTTANSSLLTTNGSGVPSWGTVLPAVTGSSVTLSGALIAGAACRIGPASSYNSTGVTPSLNLRTSSGTRTSLNIEAPGAGSRTLGLWADDSGAYSIGPFGGNSYAETVSIGTTQGSTAMQGTVTYSQGYTYGSVRRHVIDVYADATGGVSGTPDLQRWITAAGTVGLSVTYQSQLFVGNGSAPATPTAGGLLYVQSGALKYIGSSGTITTLGPA